MVDALLIVDMQKQWLSRGEAIYPSADKTIANIQKLRNHFDNNGHPIFHVFINHSLDGSDARAGEKAFAITGSEEAQIVDALKPAPSDHLIPKTRLSGFFGTNLLTTLKEQGVTGIAVTGLELRACVMATYIDAYQNDFRPVSIISDAVLDRNEL